MNMLIKQYRENEDIRLFCKILFIFLMSRLFMLVMMAAYNLGMGSSRPVESLMNPWDAQRYRYIIDYGYTFPMDADPQANWAFFPLYPIVCMIVKCLTFGIIDTFWIGMLVSNACILAAAWQSAKLMQDEGHDEISGLSIALLMLAGPYAFYGGSVYTEAMFMLFIVLFFRACRKRKFLLAGCMAALASGTRIVGCTLVFALLTELYMELAPGRVSAAGIRTFAAKMLAEPKKILAVMLCPLGTFCYMTFLYFFCGDAWAFKNVQIAWRQEENFPIIGVLLKACTGQMEPRYTYMGWFCICAFAVYGYMLYKKHYSMAIFGIIALLVPLTSHVMSTCRFIVGTYVIYIGACELLEACGRRSRKLKQAILLVLAAIEGMMLVWWFDWGTWLM